MTILFFHSISLATRTYNMSIFGNYYLHWCLGGISSHAKYLYLTKVTCNFRITSAPTSVNPCVFDEVGMFWLKFLNGHLWVFRQFLLNVSRGTNIRTNLSFRIILISESKLIRYFKIFDSFGWNCWAEIMNFSMICTSMLDIKKLLYQNIIWIFFRSL